MLNIGESVSSLSSISPDLTNTTSSDILSTNSNSSNLSYANFIIHHKKIMDSLQRAFFGGSTSTSLSSSMSTPDESNSVVSSAGEDFFDIMLPARRTFDDVNRNFSPSLIFTELTDDLSETDNVDNFFNVGNMTNEEYQQFLADLWVGIVLTLMVLSCVCCMCSCLLYHKFQQWKRSVLESRTHNPNNPEAGGDNESLPSYTIASGLPSYEEALEQLKKIKGSTTQSVSTIITTKEHGPNSLSTTCTTIAPVHHSPTSHNNNNNNVNEMTDAPSPMARLSVVDLFQIYKNTNSDTSKA